MGSVDTPRLYRKPCGTYFIRVLLPAAAALSSATIRRKRVEVRNSLRTKNPDLARCMAAWVNAALAQCYDMSARAACWSQLVVQIRKWEIPGVIKVDGPEDQRGAQEWLDKNADIRESFNYRLRHHGIPVQVNPPVNLDELRNSADMGTKRAARALPPNPTRMSAAIERYTATKVNNGTTKNRTAHDRKAALQRFCARLPDLEPPLVADPLVHEIDTYHLTAYLDSLAVRHRHGKSSEMDDAGATKAASTVLKLISDLTSFFSFALHELQATKRDPTQGLTHRARELRGTASTQKEHYHPYTTAQLQRIFDPETYLLENRSADYFWAPLLGLHLGARLGEIVTLEISSLEQEEITGVWRLAVKPEHAKTDSSVRWLPISDRLIELGFLKYIEHVRSLGATHLFPHCDTRSKTWKRMPSKNCSRQYANYLNKIGLIDPLLVFHSFRHTVVTALQDGGTPLADAMLITGHHAKDHALRTGVITAQQARSVHVSDYTHSDMVRMSVNHPMLRLKNHLDRCIRVDLDYERLARAGQVVLEHTRRQGARFTSGWPSLRAAGNTDAVARLTS